MSSPALLEALTSREVRDVIKMVGDDEFGKVRPEICEAAAQAKSHVVPPTPGGGHTCMEAAL